MRSVKPWAAALAAASIALTACGGGGDTSSSSSDAGTTASGGSALALTGTIDLKFDPTSASVDAGDVEVSLTSEGVVHNVVVEGVNGDAVVVEAQAGETATGTVSLTAGTYTFYCNVAGHREAGMEGTLTVA